jgi:hypothetical protein
MNQCLSFTELSAPAPVVASAVSGYSANVRRLPPSSSGHFADPPAPLFRWPGPTSIADGRRARATELARSSARSQTALYCQAVVDAAKGPGNTRNGLVAIRLGQGECMEQAVR